MKNSSYMLASSSERPKQASFTKIFARLAVFTFTFVAGAALAAQIVVGQVGPMPGLDAAQGRAYAAGMQLYFNALNEGGGINARPFNLLRTDDAGRPENTVELTTKVIADDQALVLAGFFGNKNMTDLLAAGLLQKNETALVGYRTSEVRPAVPYLYNVRAGLREEISKRVAHLATIGITRLGLLCEARASSAVLLEATEDAVKKDEASLVVRASYSVNTASVTSAIDTFI